MRKRVSCLLGTTVVLVFAVSGVAGANVTLGSTTEPTGAEADQCFAGGGGAADILAQITDDPSNPYTVPAGGGEITSWSTDTATADDVSATPLTLVAVRPGGDSQYSVVGADAETLPTPLPPSGVATFTVEHPIIVRGGDVLGLYSSNIGLDAPVCFFDGGTVPFDDSMTAIADPATPAAGQSLLTDSSVGPSGLGFMLDVAATVVQQQDVGVITTATPSRAAAHFPVLLSSTVTNGGPSSAPVRFTDDVPIRADDRFSRGRAGDLPDQRADGHVHDDRPPCRPVGAGERRRHAGQDRQLREQRLGLDGVPGPDPGQQQRVGDGRRGVLGG